MLLPGADLNCAGPLALWRFSQHLSAKYRGRPKKSHRKSAGPLADTVPYYVKSGPGNCILFKKRLGEGMRLKLLENSQFLPGHTFKFVGKN